MQNTGSTNGVIERVQGWSRNVAWRSVTQQKIALPLITLITAALVAVPLLMLIRASLLPEGALPFDTTGFTLKNFVDAYLDPDTLRLLRNTTIYAGGSVFGALVIASTITWLVERTNLPFRTTIRVMIFSVMIVPPLAFAFGWIMLLNPNNGALNVFLKSMLGLDEHPFDVYTLWMMIFMSATALVPTMFVMLSGVFRNMDPKFEDAGAAAGANRLRTIRLITLPLLSPGILSVAIYMLMIMVQAFEIPLAIGLTAEVHVLSVNIYLLMTPEGEPPLYGLGAAFGIGLLTLALLLMLGYFWATRVSERFHVVTGKGFRPRRIELGRWYYPALAFTFGYLCLMLTPLLILMWTSLLPFYQVPSLDAWDSLSLDNFHSMFNSKFIRRAIGNTLILIFSSATLSMLLSGVVSWFAIRSKARAARWLNMLAFAPIAIPNILVAIAILLLYIQTPLYGSIWIIVLAHVTAYLAFGTRTMNGALIQIHPELENAATACGASWGTMVRKVLLPMLWPQFLNGWLWVLAHSMRDLTMSLTLMSSGSVVLSSALWLLWSNGDVPLASALLILMLLGLLILVIPVQVYASRSDETQS